MYILFVAYYTITLDKNAVCPYTAKGQISHIKANYKMCPSNNKHYFKKLDINLMSVMSVMSTSSLATPYIFLRMVLMSQVCSLSVKNIEIVWRLLWANFCLCVWWLMPAVERSLQIRPRLLCWLLLKIMQCKLYQGHRARGSCRTLLHMAISRYYRPSSNTIN